MSTFRANRQIRNSTVRLIDENGKSVGVVPLHNALQAANDAGLDLVEVDPNAGPAICKIMDFGKFKYDQKHKAKQQKPPQLHEVAFKVETDLHDLGIKAKKTQEFLNDGDKVLMKLMFKGRQITHPDLGFQQVKTFLSLLVEGSFSLEKQPSLNGKIISAIILPVTK